MIVMAIDPGYEQSAYLLFDGARGQVVEHAIESNMVLLSRLSSGAWRLGQVDAIVLETIESYGMAVGRETFETMFWIGRFYECGLHKTREIERMPRRTVKVHLCQSARAQDSNIRVALLDRFGGKERAIGKKSQPGPLYGIKKHEWAALAVAVTWWDQHRPDVQAVR